jgi:hypothetical protein
MVLPFRAAPPALLAAPAPPRVPARTRRTARVWVVIAFGLLVFDAALLFLVVRGLR